MKRSRLIRFSSLLLVPLATPALAHHSFAMFDRSRTETISGTVKQFELINPHGWLRLMVLDANGAPNEWSVELGGAGQLERFGWSSGTVRPGDKVTVQLHPLRDGSYGGQLVSVTLPSGQVLGQRPAAGP
jgi:Family of unknown function (DUF6152)